jgi:hypothetical protein
VGGDPPGPQGTRSRAGHQPPHGPPRGSGTRGPLGRWRPPVDGLGTPGATSPLRAGRRCPLLPRPAVPPPLARSPRCPHASEGLHAVDRPTPTGRLRRAGGVPQQAWDRVGRTCWPHPASRRPPPLPHPRPLAMGQEREAGALGVVGRTAARLRPRVLWGFLPRAQPRTLPVSGGPQGRTPGTTQKACAVGRPLHWIVRPGRWAGPAQVPPSMPCPSSHV